MKQEAAQQIIDQAVQHQQIVATLDTSFTKCSKDGTGGFRVRLVHHRARRVLVIERMEQWESVLLAWQDL